MRTFSTVVVGGGAAGIAAAISAGRKGASVVLCEKTERLGKKILASGNGRCNLSNEDLRDIHYNDKARPLVRSIFFRFGPNRIGSLFSEMGLHLRSDSGRIFPSTNQSVSVLSILQLELKRLEVITKTACEISSVSRSSDGFIVTTKSADSITARAVIITCGGNSYPAFGSDGSGYALAKQLGHTIIKPVPVTVPLVTKDPICHRLQGQKIAATVRAFIGDSETLKAEGDVLFTKYGLSGTAILDVSAPISVAINRHGRKDIRLVVDMVPFMSEKDLIEELAKRARRGLKPDEMIVGILPNKFGLALREIIGSDPISTEEMARALKNRVFSVLGTRGWNEAEFTAGGVDVNEIDIGTLQSRIQKGLYFAGEILDVHGRRGGYNLAWAWASGFIAGEESVCAR